MISPISKTNHVGPSAKSYINGLALQGMGSVDDLSSDPVRIGFIQRALESASLMIQTQYESPDFRRSFKYTMVSADKGDMTLSSFHLD